MLTTTNLGVDTFLKAFECPRGILRHDLPQFVSNNARTMTGYSLLVDGSLPPSA